jgi:hypothetical protein
MCAGAAMSNNIHDCNWCHAIDVDYTIGHSGVAFPKACAICGHQEGEYWGWKELRVRFDELRADVKSKDKAIIELLAEIDELMKANESMRITLGAENDRMERADAAERKLMAINAAVAKFNVELDEAFVRSVRGTQ